MPEQVHFLWESSRAPNLTSKSGVIARNMQQPQVEVGKGGSSEQKSSKKRFLVAHAQVNSLLLCVFPSSAVKANNDESVPKGVKK